MAIPYAPSTPYRQNNSIADLMLQSGQDQARLQAQNSAMWANTIGSLGGIASGAVQDYQAGKSEQQAAAAKAAADAPRLAQESEKRGLELDNLKNAQKKEAMELARAQKLEELFSGEAPPTPNQLVSLLGPERGLALSKGLETLKPDSEAKYKDQASLLRDTLYGVAAVPKAAQPKAYDMARQNLLSRGLISEDMAPAEFNEEWLTQAINYGKAPQEPEAFNLSPGQTRFEGGKPIASLPPTPEKQSQARTWVTRNGQKLFVRESEVKPGDQPASTREQGRPVTAGDAGRIAEIDNGILQAQQLKPELKTGTASKVGAMLWNPITDATGIGSESKQQQAKIDLVKQIIGKALEGGVLRKEDEVKYAKILPTIGDPDSVAQAKIDNLISLLGQRREIELSAREDAGYDVSKFRERGAKASAKPDPLGIR